MTLRFRRIVTQRTVCPQAIYTIQRARLLCLQSGNIGLQSMTHGTTTSRYTHSEPTTSHTPARLPPLRASTVLHESETDIRAVVYSHDAHVTQIEQMHTAIASCKLTVTIPHGAAAANSDASSGSLPPFTTMAASIQQLRDCAVRFQDAVQQLNTERASVLSAPRVSVGLLSHDARDRAVDDDAELILPPPDLTPHLLATPPQDRQPAPNYIKATAATTALTTATNTAATATVITAIPRASLCRQPISEHVSRCSNQLTCMQMQFDITHHMLQELMNWVCSVTVTCTATRNIAFLISLRADMLSLIDSLLTVTNPLMAINLQRTLERMDRRTTPNTQLFNACVQVVHLNTVSALEDVVDALGNEQHKLYRLIAWATVHACTESWVDAALTLAVQSTKHGVVASTQSQYAEVRQHFVSSNIIGWYRRAPD
jgi:hypothetical protein